MTGRLKYRRPFYIEWGVYKMFEVRPVTSERNLYGKNTERHLDG